MNWDQIKGHWMEYKGKARAKWGDLTDDDFEKIAGNRAMLIGKLQEKYGKKKEEIEHEVDSWMNDLGEGGYEERRMAS